MAEMKKYLALGLGVQSTWLYFASTFGYLPKMAAAVFADPGREKTATMKYLDWLVDWAAKYSDIPIHVAQRGNLFNDLIDTSKKRSASIPAFTMGKGGKEGMLRRQCTREYKVEATDRMVRSLEGVGYGQRMAHTVELWMGISFDEIDRMSIPADAWKYHVYPFCDYIIPSNGQAQKGLYNYTMRRSDILVEYKRHRLPIPPKSACVFCPYQSDYAWYDLKINDPEGFADAVAVDEAIRDLSKHGVRSPAFLHRSCKPLREISFSAQASDLWGGECSGICHT